jgi:hypothetical protein
MLHIQLHAFFTWYLFLDFLTLKDGTDKLSRNVGKNSHRTLCSIPEEHRSLVLYVGELLYS